MALIVGAFSGVGAQSPAPRVISGTVRDSTGAPAFYVQVIADETHRALTDRDGAFRLEVEPGNPVVIETRRIGFRPLKLRLPAGGDTTLALVLEPVAQGLRAVEVTAKFVHVLENDGFYARMADRLSGIGGGEFITPEEIELRHAVRTTQLLDQVHGLLVRRMGDCAIASQCWSFFGPTGCIMTIYLDGQRLMPENMTAYMHRTGPPSRRPQDQPVVFIDAIVPPGALAGIEVYSRGVRAPPQYQMLNGTCGVVLIWTK